MSEPRLEAGRPDDLPAVRDLLARSALPLDGADALLGHLVVARDERGIVGTAGLEMYPSGALLRSVAVEASARGQGIGQLVTDAALSLARDAGVGAVFLLTTTADGFFPRFGFARVERDEVPADIRASVEFVSACPASAVVMRKVF